MAKEPKPKDTSAGNFLDEIIADILSASDKEVLEEDALVSSSLGDSVEEFVNRAVDAAIIATGKRRFEVAAQSLRQSTKIAGSNVIPIDRQRLRKQYEESLRQSGFKLSMAARGGSKVTDKDIDSAIDDLAELGGLGDKTPPAQ
jgi:hypothetical protein